MDENPILLQKDLGMLCNDMQDLLLDVESKMSLSLKRQEQTYLNAFRKVKDKMIRQLQNVQTQFYDFKE